MKPVEKVKFMEGRKALQVYLDEETHAQFKAFCSLRNKKMSEVTDELIKQWIQEQMKKSPWLK